MVRDLFIATNLHEPKMADPRCRAIYGKFINNTKNILYIKLLLIKLILKIGLDVMIDLNNFEPKMLEITFSPDCIRACKFTPSFYNDIFGLLFLNKNEDETNHIRIV